MKSFCNRFIIFAIIFFTFPVVCHAGFFSDLLGLGSYEDCIEADLKKAKTSREIKKINDACRQSYPAKDTMTGSKRQNINLPFVAVPSVPVVSKPLLPVVSSPLE